MVYARRFVVQHWLATHVQMYVCCRYVAKSSLRQGKQLAGNVAEMEEDVNAHMMASQFAKAFNAALDAVQPHAKKLLFHDVHLVVLEDRTIPVGPQSALFLEPYLDGK